MLRTLIWILVATPSLAWAWPPDGLRVTGAPRDQVAPSFASDGQGGAFVTWLDYRADGPLRNGLDVYIQHITAPGAIAPGWPVDGLAVATGPGHQNGIIASDGTGGVLIVFTDTSVDEGDLYLQRITAQGVVAAGWPVSGVPIGVGPGLQYSPELIADGQGGAFVSWQVGSEVASTQARFTHVLANGELSPGWPANGRPFEPSPGFILRPLLLATEDGGFIACWSASEDGLATVRMLAQRFTAAGQASSAWGVDGVTVCPLRPFHRVPGPPLVSDGAGGFFVLLEDYRNSASAFENLDSYVQHVLASGQVAPGWPVDALPIATHPTVDEQGIPVGDTQGGLFVTWHDSRAGFPQVFGLHLGPDGQRYPGWPTGGLRLSSRSTFQFGVSAVPDRMGGAFLIWTELTGLSRVYIKRVQDDGSAAPGWPADGLLVSSAGGEQDEASLVADGIGGVIVGWGDTRDYAVTFTDIYAQRFSGGGVVATQVSVASTEADVNEVRVRWHVSGESRASAERREGDGDWLRRAELTADGTGYMSLVDRDVVPGTRYDYRLSFAGGTHGGETSITIPALRLALEGARPNPAVGAVMLAFTLPDVSAARLELFDLSGRRLASREVGARGAGRHVERFDGSTLAPGLYWASLTHGGRTLRARIAVTR